MPRKLISKMCRRRINFTMTIGSQNQLYPSLTDAVIKITLLSFVTKNNEMNLILVAVPELLRTLQKLSPKL
jgi:hypothetical protein